MRINKPVTSTENHYSEKSNLVSVTDLQGNITYVNRDFIEVSRFTEEELLGQPHNLVRHPDMPVAAFEDMWQTLKADKPWRGMVKNRCKNGDYYWVDAYVTPVFNGTSKTGYQSVRSCPTREQVSAAEALYAKMRNDPQMKVPHKVRWFDRSLRTLNTLVNGSLIFLAVVTLFLMNLSDSSWPIYLSLSLMMLLALVSMLLINGAVISPMQNMVKLLRRMAAGDLTNRIEVKNKNETGELLMATKLLQARLTTVLGQFNESAENLTSTASAVSMANHDTRQGMMRQHNETDQVATAINEMSATVQEVASSASRASESSHDAQELAEQGSGVVRTTKEAINNLAQEVSRTSEVVNELAENSSKISTITDTISAIAEQTNLLALNAAIEAARAGEQGRGFAVVADEVRTLASRTQDATREIRSMIDNLHQGIGTAVDVMQKGMERASDAVDRVQETEETFSSIVNAVVQINDMNLHIATAAEEQSSVTEEINRNVQAISEQSTLTESTAALLQNNADEMSSMAKALHNQLAQFNLGESAISFDFASAKSVHLDWKKRVRAFLDGDTAALTEQQACSHRGCKLGTWYYSAGLQKYGNIPAFKAIEAPHERLHQLICEIVRFQKAGQHQQAEALFKEIEPLSAELVSLLDKAQGSIVTRR